MIVDYKGEANSVTIIDSNNAVEASDCAHYLIISATQHILSPSIYCTLGQVSMVHPDELTEQDVTQSDLIFIVDDNLSEGSVSWAKRLVKKYNRDFVIAICRNKDHRARWRDYADSAYYTICDTEQRNFINRLIESIELQGFVCIDFADVYVQFCKTGITKFYQGIAVGKFRGLRAIDDAIENTNLEGDCVLLILTGGLDVSLDEWLSAVQYLEGKLSSDCCLTSSVKVRPDVMDTEQVMVSIFVNKKAGYKTNA